MVAHFISPKLTDNNTLNTILYGLIQEKLAKNITISPLYLQRLLSDVLGGSDADNYWQWKDAYEILEIAQIKYLQSQLPQLTRESTVKLLQNKLPMLVPTHTRRTTQQIKLQQFSTPLHLAYLATTAAKITPQDTVLEPSAGNGNLAVFAHQAKKLILNEIESNRNYYLQYLFPQAKVYQLNAEQINDRLPTEEQPSVILLNPPFTSYLNQTVKQSSALFEHLLSALKRLQPQGRLVIISQESARANNPVWSRRFNQIKNLATMVFTAGIEGKEYRKMGTSLNTRITVFDKTPQGDAAMPVIHGILEFEELLKRVLDIPNRLTLVKPKQSQKLIIKPTTSKRTRKSKYPEGQMSLFSIAPETGNFIPSIALNPNPSKVNITKAKIKFTLAPKIVSPSTPKIKKPNNTWAEASRLIYTTNEEILTSKEEGLYQTYRPQNLQITGSCSHPAMLVESKVMAAIKPPKPTYQPLLPPNIVTEGVLSEAQLEAVIRAGDAHSKILQRWVSYNSITETHHYHDYKAENSTQIRKGFYCGDSTGVGKARIVAGTILDNYLQGQTKAVWITVNNRLIEDARKEWCALGGNKDDIFCLNSYSQSTEVLHSQGIMFVTYGTLRTKAKQNKISRVKQIANWLGHDFQGVIAFDEAHLMGGAKSVKGEMGDSKASAQGLAGIKLQNFVPQARVLYLSATAATRLENLVYAERLGLWGVKDSPFSCRDSFISKINKGGITALEIVARHMKLTGVYLSRSIGFTGVEYATLEHQLTDEQVAIYNKYCQCYKIIYNNIIEALRNTNAASSSHIRRNSYSTFENSKQRFFAQLLLSMKTPMLIEAMEEDIKQNRAPVVQLISTNEAVLTRKLEQIDKAEWNDLHIDLTPREVVLDYLNNSFPVVLMEKVGGDGSGYHYIEAKDENGRKIINQEALAQKNALIREVMLLPPIATALDQLVFHFGDRLGEVTGRSTRLVRYDDHGQTKVKIENRTKTDNLADVTSFMNGEKKVLVFSTAGGTGASYHASKDCQNQKQRVHYILEAGYRADICLQGFGRTHRSNQACPPKFVLTCTNVKGEKRFISTIAKRLSSLGAITKGERQAGNANIFKEEDNLESGYAWQGLYNLYRRIVHNLCPGFDLNTFEQQTNLILTNKNGLRPDLPPMRRFLNRVLALEIEQQNELFTHLENNIKTVIDRAKELGTYDTGVQTIKGNLQIIDKKILWKDPESGTPTIANKILVIKKNPIVTWEEAKSIYRNHQGSYIFNTSSKKIAIKIKTASIANESGIGETQYRLIRPGNSSNIAEADYSKSAWIDIPELECCRLWNYEVSQLPEFIKEYFYLVSGLILPLWDSLGNSSLKIWRLTDSQTGESILGRKIRAEEIEDVYRNFKQDIDLEPEELIASANKGTTITIKGNLKLKSSKVAYKQRLELIGWQNSDLPRLTSYGCFEETINWKIRLFISPENALEIISKIKNY